MSDDFKQKLKDYMEGNLSEEERLEMEQELEKMEEYQAFLEEQMGGDDGKIDSDTNIKKQKKVLRRGKWKARFQNAVIVLCLFVIGSIFCGFLTSAFYIWGNRGAIYPDVIRSTVAVTQPNVKIQGGSSHSNFFFTMDFKGELTKQIGVDSEKIGQMTMQFLLGWPSYPDWEREDVQHANFTYPSADPKYSEGYDPWFRLEKLPEGTVAEAYISFDQTYPTAEVFDMLEGRNFRPVWFAVDTVPKKEKRQQFHVEPIGMPLIPVYHTSDRKSGSVNFSTGNPEKRNKRFIQTLKLMAQHENIVSKVEYGLSSNLLDRIHYIKKHGVNIYGVVVTGPSKEILKLRNEKWAATVDVGEVRLWNWHQ